ncbi:hypothetical protein SteCoe_24068 [Stentor coeruleus]|uniref:Uncharacterized protein n=1 Tax=Stentor coeruleus TaxID=5963 RepID=A0A1R2BIM4_9CILI|nr:hypothetical protein SteCoe_24068 [Stentor coeruleus]
MRQNVSLNTLKELVCPQGSYTKEQLLDLINTDDYKTEIEILAAYFSDICEISSNLNLIITIVSQNSPSIAKIIDNNIFSNPISIFIYAINDNNYDHVYPLSHSNEIIFPSNKTLTFQNYINILLSPIFIEKLESYHLSKIIDVLKHEKYFSDKVSELSNYLINLENENHDITNEINEDIPEYYQNEQNKEEIKEEVYIPEYYQNEQKKEEIKEDYIPEYYQNTQIKPSKNFLAVPDENKKNNFKLYKVIGPNGKNVRIGFKNYEEIQRITNDPMYVKSFVGDYFMPDIPYVPMCQFATDIENPPVPEMNAASPQSYNPATNPYSVFKEEVEFNPD